MGCGDQLSRIDAWLKMASSAPHRLSDEKTTEQSMERCFIIDDYPEDGIN